MSQRHDRQGFTVSASPLPLPCPRNSTYPKCQNSNEMRDRIHFHLAVFRQKPPNGARAIYPDEKIIVHDTQLKLSTTPHVDRSNAGFSRAISVGDKSPQGIWVADDKTMSYDTLTDTHYQGSRIATTLEIPPPSHWKRHMKKKCGTETTGA